MYSIPEYLLSLLSQMHSEVINPSQVVIQMLNNHWLRDSKSCPLAILNNDSNITNYCLLFILWVSPGGSDGQESACTQETCSILGWEYLLRRAWHSPSILAWESTFLSEEPGRLCGAWDCKKSPHDWVTANTQHIYLLLPRGSVVKNWLPMQEMQV